MTKTENMQNLPSKYILKLIFYGKNPFPGLIEKIDVIILLAGLYNNNKENFNDLIEASKNFDIPIVLVRPHGLEEVPESLEKEASTIVGWNANCIVDAIKNAEEMGRI